MLLVRRSLPFSALASAAFFAAFGCPNLGRSVILGAAPLPSSSNVAAAAAALAYLPRMLVWPRDFTALFDLYDYLSLRSILVLGCEFYLLRSEFETRP